MIQATECEHLRGTMLDAAAGLVPRSAEFECHLRTCFQCFERFDELRRTMELLDEWRGPRPSSQFDALLRVRLLEAKAAERARWWSRLSQPVVAVSFATLSLVGVVALQRTTRSPVSTSAPQESELRALPGSAVGDLQSLEAADGLFADFDLLDQLAPDQQNASGQN